MDATEHPAGPPAGGAVAVSVVEPDEAIRRVLAKHVETFELAAQPFEDLASFSTNGASTEPSVLLVGPSRPAGDVLGELRPLLEARPNCGAIMVVFDLSTDVLREAMRAGVDDVVSVNADDTELLDAIQRASARVRSRLAASAPVAAPVPPPAPAGPTEAPRARVVTVFSTKGGAGKSVVATNVAVCLARRTSQPVVLLDADLQFGDVALMLQLAPVHTIVEAVQAGDRLDGVLLENLLLRHPASGLRVLAAPTEPGSADHINRADLSRILALLRDRCAFVVVDNPATFGDVTLGALEEADDILVVAGLDVTSIKNARVGLQTMRVLGIPFSKIKFIVNRANSKVGLSVADAERALELKSDCALPSDIIVPQSVNRGMPAVITAPKSKFARAVEDLTTAIVAGAAARPAPAPATPGAVP